MIKVVTFDMWGTLIDDIDYTLPKVECLSNALRRMNTPRSPERIMEAFTATYEYAHRTSRTEDYRYVTNQERLDHVLKRLSGELTEGLNAEVLKTFEDVAGANPPPLAEGVRQTLEHLRSIYHLGIVSDSGITPGRVLRRIPLQHQVLGFFDATVFSDEIGHNKPHRAMFEKALATLTVEPREAVHVGDLLHTDVAGAKAVGMKAVWLKRQRSIAAEPYMPDYEIRTFQEIADILKRIG